jgi:hypothetical protein
MAMMAMTTSSSIKVNPKYRLLFIWFLLGVPSPGTPSD